MAKDDLATITGKLFALLEPLSSEDRQKAVSATLTLLGEQAPSVTSTLQQESGGGGEDEVGDGNKPNPKSFFEQKDPQNKGEELAVAARYRESHENSHVNTREDFQRVITKARRNFDGKNFNRDLNNAKIKGLFNKGNDHPLSYYGQKYVDAMPDRDAVKKIKKPKVGSRKKATKKKTSKKKTTS